MKDKIARDSLSIVKDDIDVLFERVDKVERSQISSRVKRMEYSVNQGILIRRVEKLEALVDLLLKDTGAKAVYHEAGYTLEVEDE